MFYSLSMLKMALLIYMHRSVNFMQMNGKTRSLAMLRVRNVFFMIKRSVNSKFKSYVIYLTFTTCYVKGYQHVKNFNEDLFICGNRNFEGYCWRLPTRPVRNVGFQHRAYITVNEQIAWYVSVSLSFGNYLYVFISTKRTSYLDTMYKSVRNLSWFCTGK